MDCFRRFLRPLSLGMMIHLFSFGLFAQSTRCDLSDRERRLISHVEMSLQRGEEQLSKLTKGPLKIRGMSSPKTRHFLNNLCSLPHANYLEIGCWKGSTWIAALFGNESTISSAVAIDDWSEFGGPQKIFLKNCSKFLSEFDYKVLSENCFTVDLHSVFSQPVQIYLYDGNHTAISQELAFVYYNDILDDTFIAVVDDWNWSDVQLGTRKAFDRLNYQILFERALPAGISGSDTEQWWNGLYVAVIRKT
jgi:hypothetical protein